jgi:Ca-activated chloride channel family protein
MRGGPLMYALRAVCSILDLMGPYDRLHFITYDNEAVVVVENGTVNDKELIYTKINQVEAGGGTNIEAGLKAAKNLLERDNIPTTERR